MADPDCTWSMKTNWCRAVGERASFDQKQEGTLHEYEGLVSLAYDESDRCW